ncbi:MAG TPA: hypothetical protein DCK98_13885 [Chloroflexi bacterium]|jgi:hypothetical protein|nr:hypothetical protein [Chloroflexota bacterium]HAL28264.1 hypothetical protein [Chloroflexota bacterium]
MELPTLQTWELYYPEAAATGIEVSRARLDPTAVVWVHAAPPVLAVTVREGDDRVLARGASLKRAGPQLPMTRLEQRGANVTREDRWPTDTDLGAVVILPGGEAGVLKSWWNAADGNEWRWTVEFSNRRG